MACELAESKARPSHELLHHARHVDSAQVARPDTAATSDGAEERSGPDSGEVQPFLVERAFSSGER